MDTALLSSKGVTPDSIAIGYVDEFALRIGERATLVRATGARSWGVVANITAEEATALYAEDSVADYLPEPVRVNLTQGMAVDAVCYNLPAGKITGTNPDYAQSLMTLAVSLGFPDVYLDQITPADGYTAVRGFRGAGHRTEYP